MVNALGHRFSDGSAQDMGLINEVTLMVVMYSNEHVIHQMRTAFLLYILMSSAASRRHA